MHDSSTNALNVSVDEHPFLLIQLERMCVLLAEIEYMRPNNRIATVVQI